MAEERTAGRGGQVVVFALAGEEYAVAVSRVQEIIRYVQPRSIGSSVPWVRGVISLRGRIVPVCDLAARLGTGWTEPGPDTKIVICEAEDSVAGVVVDEVSEVLTLKDDQLDELPAAGAEFQDGVAKVGDRLIVVLSPDRMLRGLAELAAGDGAGDGDGELLLAA